MRGLAPALVVGACAWPLMLAGAVAARLEARPSTYATIVYAAASHVCHQIDARSFHYGEAKWPVCARCSGLYLGAPVGAVAAATLVRRRRSQVLRWLALAAVPTAITLGAEILGVAAPTNLMRLLAALPLGGMIAFVIVQTAKADKDSVFSTVK